MLVLLLALAHVITSVEDAIAHLGSFVGAVAGSGHVGVGIGAWMTTAAAAVLFIGTLRLLLSCTVRHHVSRIESLFSASVALTA